MFTYLNSLRTLIVVIFIILKKSATVFGSHDIHIRLCCLAILSFQALVTITLHLSGSVTKPILLASLLKWFLACTNKCDIIYKV